MISGSTKKHEKKEKELDLGEIEERLYQKFSNPDYEPPYLKLENNGNHGARKLLEHLHYRKRAKVSDYQK